MLLVALSRVSQGNDIRILPLIDKNGLDYLMRLKYDEDLEIWMAGFDEETRMWSKERSIEFLTEKAKRIQQHKQDARVKTKSKLPDVAKQGRYELLQYSRKSSDMKHSAQKGNKDSTGGKVFKSEHVCRNICQKRWSLKNLLKKQYYRNN